MQKVAMTNEKRVFSDRATPAVRCQIGAADNKAHNWNCDVVRVRVDVWLVAAKQMEDITLGSSVKYCLCSLEQDNDWATVSWWCWWDWAPQRWRLLFSNTKLVSDVRVCKIRLPLSLMVGEYIDKAPECDSVVCSETQISGRWCAWCFADK